MSQISKYTANSFQSLDTLVRRRAELAFNNSFDDFELEVIHEQDEDSNLRKPREHLSKTRLAQLDKNRSKTIDASVKTKSVMSAIRTESIYQQRIGGQRDIFENRNEAKSVF